MSDERAFRPSRTSLGELSSDRDCTQQQQQRQQQPQQQHQQLKSIPRAPSHTITLTNL
ncbi:hypothetical protein K440DRAFT_612118 [Wilcoxina mikolae CBS 423.85]|nr:hypothetical protein K440DRAFT_612118 [Wilcoxina mikolae CBS 423.85]